MPYIEKHKSCQPAWPKSILLRVVTIFFQECISEFWMIEEYFKFILDFNSLSTKIHVRYNKLCP